MKVALLKSLKFRLPLFVLLGAIPITLLAILIASSAASKIIRQETQENLALKSAALGSDVSRWTQTNVLALKNLTQQPSIVSQSQQQKSVLKSIVNVYQHNYLAFTSDLNGLNVARSDDQPLNNYQDRDYFQQAKAGKAITFQALFGRTSKKPSLCMSAPINQQQTISGVAVICSVLEEITQQVGAVKFNQTGYGFVVDEQGQILGHPDANLISGNGLVDYSSHPSVANFLAGQAGYLAFTDKSGTEWISHSTRLNNGWGAFVLQKKSEAFAKIREFQYLAAAIAGITVLAVSVLIWLLASRLTKPITEITAAAVNLAAGDLEQTIELQQGDEIGVLATAFNQMAKQLQKSITSLETQTVKQQQEKEQLDLEIFALIEEVSNAIEGDLTVRASSDSAQLATVADLFNAIIDNLKEIAIETQRSSSQVGSSLRRNETAILTVAEQAMKEAKETRDSLVSVEYMSQSIQTVADNAREAEQIANDTYNTVALSSSSMNSTVNNILQLRNTVGETAKKMEDLGASSEKITQAVSFIEEIAFKTNVLAINASAEAERAGEYGQGFIIIAEQVGALAKQSTAATQEIAGIATAIQFTTQEISQAMNSGNTQVIESVRLVEANQKSLSAILDKSQKINQLMKSVAEATVTQAGTSKKVNNLMEKVASLSETTSQSSKAVAQSIINTADVAAKLESTVAQFKVAEVAE